jgi:hypothetical protein
MVTLGLLASCRPQEARLRFGFHPLGNDLDVKFTRKANGRPNHCGISWIVGDAKHQLLGDLEPVNRINSQIFE